MIGSIVVAFVRCGDFSLDYSLTEKGVIVEASRRLRVPENGVVPWAVNLVISFLASQVPLRLSLLPPWCAW